MPPTLEPHVERETDLVGDVERAHQWSAERALGTAGDHPRRSGTPLLVNLKLRLKLALTGTPVGRLAENARWLTHVGRRRRHPELWDFYLDGRRTDLVLQHLVEPTWNCVDCGSHVGSVLALFRSLAPEGRHVAIEADEHKAVAIRRRFRDVEVHAVALGADTGWADFLVDRVRPGFSRVLPSGGPDERAQSVSVPVARLDDVIDHDVQLIKIDIEGAELPALRGAKSLLSRCQPVLLFECGTDESLRCFEYDRRALFSLLVEEHGYCVYSLIDFLYGRPPLTLAEFQKAGLYPFPGFNFLALPAGTPVTRRV